MKMSIIDIKKFIKILLLGLDNLNNDTSFTFDEDLYWNIQDEELYNAYKDPSELTMGSLIEDWGFLQTVVNGDREIIDYDIYKFAAILKFLGKKMIITKVHNSTTI